MNPEFRLPDRGLGDSVLVVDNYDSFTFNLVQFLGELGARCVVVRNDTATVAEIVAAEPAAIVISPGPKTPSEAGITVGLIRALGPRLPILGVCLGHQGIGEAYGGRIVRAPAIMHGKRSSIHHRGDGLFAGLADPFVATRYHSLVIEPESLPGELEITAWTEEGVIMGVRHRHHPVAGVQFHPESILTDSGHRLLANFLSTTGILVAA